MVTLQFKRLIKSVCKPRLKYKHNLLYLVMHFPINVNVMRRLAGSDWIPYMVWPASYTRGQANPTCRFVNAQTLSTSRVESVTGALAIYMIWWFRRSFQTIAFDSVFYRKYSVWVLSTSKQTYLYEFHQKLWYQILRFQYDTDNTRAASCLLAAVAMDASDR